MSVYKCIYCLQEKDESEFNREHVVPQMMGKYQNGYVLNRYQVCQECNTYFCNELENKIGLDSYEALLRIQHRTRPMSDGHHLTSNRVIVVGDEGVFKGLPFEVITDQSNTDRIALKALPMIGIINDIENSEYNYYFLNELPVASPEIIDRMRRSSTPIINTGIPVEEAEPILIEKGYLPEKYTYSNTSVSNLFSEPEFMTQINIKIDSLVRRVCAKTAFNFLCYTKGVDYVLKENFDSIRKYIRYGIWDDELWFNYSRGEVSSIETPNETSHIVGNLWYTKNQTWNICGCVTWFGDITYCFHLGKNIKPIKVFNYLDPTHVAVFDNVGLTIKDEECVHIYEGRIG